MVCRPSLPPKKAAAAAASAAAEAQAAADAAAAAVAFGADDLGSHDLDDRDHSQSSGKDEVSHPLLICCWLPPCILTTRETVLRPIISCAASAYGLQG